VERYDKELKERVLKEVSEVGNMSAVARKYELKVQTVSSWVQAHKNKDQRGSKAELRKLRSELEDAKLENQILKELLKKTNLVWLGDSK